MLLGSVHSELQREYGKGDSADVEVTTSKVSAPVRLKRSQTDDVVNPNAYTLEDLEMGPVLGEGTFGRVQLVTAPDKTKWALKIMMKAQIVEMSQTKQPCSRKKLCVRFGILYFSSRQHS